MLTDWPVVFESLKMMRTKHFIDGHLSYIYKNFFRARHDFVLSLQTLELVQTKSNMSSHSVRFSSAGVLNLSNKDKSN